MKKAATLFAVFLPAFCLSACSLVPKIKIGGDSHDRSSPYPAEKDCSAGLAYRLNENGKGYTVTGIGGCRDADPVIPATHEGGAGLFTIRFDGTAAAWCALPKATVPPVPVTCADGTVMPDGTVQ